MSGGPIPRPILDRVADNVALTDSGCLLWLGSRTADGYGAIKVRLDGVRRDWRAHRLVYELLVGPIPDGMEPDHTCRNKLCVHPDHLEPVTHAENLRRAWVHSKNRVRNPTGRNQWSS